jgi:hypothetical protein
MGKEIQIMINIIVMFNLISIFFIYIDILFCYKILRNVKKDEKYSLISIYNKKEGRYVFIFSSIGGLCYGIILLFCAIVGMGWLNVLATLGIVMYSGCASFGLFLLSRITSKNVPKKLK